MRGKEVAETINEIRLEFSDTNNFQVIHPLLSDYMKRQNQTVFQDRGTSLDVGGSQESLNRSAFINIHEVGGCPQRQLIP